ncbi:MAG: GNAT family N-acetyltransferase [Microlunatus sp.]
MVAAADGTGVRVRELSGIAEMVAASTLWDTIWARREDGHEVDPALMVALSHAGGYLAAAFDDDAMIGAVLGFWGRPAAGTLHSHVTGVLPSYAGQGVGAAIKNHQRSWVLDRGGVAITWTFDPLVSRNAHFNLNRLGARPDHYLHDLYGELSDDINRGDPTDRLLVRWSLTTPPPPPSRRPAAALLANHDGEPVVGLSLDGIDSDAALTVAVPDDIEALRRSDPAAASLWRVAVRQAMAPLLERDWLVTGFDRGVGYRLEPPHATLTSSTPDE